MPSFRFPVAWAFAALCLASSASRAAAQIPDLWFDPPSRSYPAPDQQLSVHVCGDIVSQTSIKVWLNGTQLTPTFSGGDPSLCAVHWVATVTAHLNPGTNWLKAKGCGTSFPSTCITDSTTYVKTADVTKPTGSISPASGTSFSVSRQYVSATWCDDYKLTRSTAQMWLNGASVAVTTGDNGSSPGCGSGAWETGELSFQPGANAVKAVIRDSVGNVSDTLRATYTYTPAVSLVGEDRVRRPDLCALGCFDARLAFSGVPYVSMDRPHAVTLAYSSAAARPRGFVQVDVGVGSGPVPNRIGLRVLSGTTAMALLGGSQTQVWYTGRINTNRVSAWFDAASLATGTYRYTAEVTRDYGTSTAIDTLGVRVIVINASNSPYGAGWSLAQEQRIVVPSGGMDVGGVTLVQGDGTASFFTAPAGCGPTGPCTYVSPPGEFTTLVRTSTFFARLGVAGDSAVFGLDGRLQRVIDPFNNADTYTYDASGGVGTMTDPAGHALALMYDGSGKLFSFGDSDSGWSTGVVVDASGNLVKVAVPANGLPNPWGDSQLDATYDATHRLLSWTDRAGNTTNLSYDAWGTLSRVIGPAFRAQGSSAWRDTTSFRSQEAAVLPSAGTGTSTTPAAGVDGAAVWTWAAGVRGDTVKMRLDGWGAAATTVDRWGYTSTEARNADGFTTSVTDANGNTATTAWNGPRPVQTATPEGTISNEYNGPGQRLSRQYGATPETKYFYADASRRFVLDSVHVEGSGTTRYTYDAKGRVLTVSDSAGHSTTTVYDTTGWRNTRQVITGGSRITTYGGWDGWGRPNQVTAPDNTVTYAHYDELGRVTDTTAPDGGLTVYFYGAAGLDSIYDPRGKAWSWTHNQLGWVEAEIRPDDAGQHRTAVYDRFGRVVSATDRRARTLNYAYDSHDRVTQRVAVTEHDTTTWAYSPDQPTAQHVPSWVFVRNGVSTDSLHYDGLGRPSRAVTLRAGGTRTYAIAYGYTFVGQLDSVTYRVNGGTAVSSVYSYDPFTQMLRSVQDFGGRRTQLAYDGEGLLSRITWPSGPYAALSYMSEHLLSRIGYSAPALDGAATLGFIYDAQSRVGTISSAGDTRYRNFTFDANGRLASHQDEQRSNRIAGCTLQVDVGWVCPDDSNWSIVAQRSYTWDRNGNPTDHGAVVQTAGNRLTTYDGWTLSYDAEGNLTGKSKTGSPSYTYTWNSLGQLATASVNGVLAATYAYDGMGRRVTKTVSGSTRQYVYDGDDLLLDVNPDGTILSEYTYLGTDAPLGVRRSGTQYYFATDPRGSVLAVSDLSGNVVNQYRYSPFGAAESTTEGVANNLRWSGREWDADANLYYNRARWYDPQIERFVSQDPIGLEGGMNLYSYGDNDPVNARDASGMLDCWESVFYLPKGGRSQGTVGIPFLWGMDCDLLRVVSSNFHFYLMEREAADARACPWWVCTDGLPPGAGLVDYCWHSDTCRPTLHEANVDERAAIRSQMDRVTKGGFCSLAKAQALADLSATPVRFGIYSDRHMDLGERAVLKPNEHDASTWISIPYLRSGSINAPTILHEVGHELTTPDHPFGLEHGTMVDVPGYGQVKMCQAAFRCVDQMANTGC